jgi:putative glutamine amidotransferase
MKRSIVFFFAGLLLLTTLSIECQTRIAISKSFPSYETWLKHCEAGAHVQVETRNMYVLGIDSALKVLSTCSGLLLTGGEDVYPGKYGKMNELSRCEEMDRYRDSLEFALIEKALALGIPIFGICRGEQILNVALGGSLYTDIPTEFGTAVLHRCPPGSDDCLHAVTIEPQSLFFRITGQKAGTVNSYHHQAVDKTGPGVKVVARAENGVVEAIERVASDKDPMIMGVQWHPEGLQQNSDLSYPLAVYFLKQAARK